MSKNKKITKGRNDPCPDIYNKGWNTVEDFERDLILFADIEQPDDRKPQASTPETIRKFNETMKNNRRSIYTDCEIDESLTYFVSGRGKGVIDRVIRPGQGITPLPSDDVELKRQIRQVSGLGSSNALIEQSIKANYIDQPSTNEVDWSVWESAGIVKSSRNRSNVSSTRESPTSIPECATSPASEPIATTSRAPELQPVTVTPQSPKTDTKNLKK